MAFFPYVLLGERCRGTNIIEKLIERNSPYRPDWSITGFKHFPKPLQSGMAEYVRELPIAVVFRDPFSWIESLYRSPCYAAPHLKDLMLSEFMRSE